MNRIPKRVPAILCLILFCQSCYRDPSFLHPPVHFPIQILEQTPLKSFLDSINGLGSSVQLTIQSVTINNPFIPHAEVPGQAVIGYSFRSSVAGKVTSLGIRLPARAFSHTVSLWDSVTRQILAQADVPSLDSGKFTYVSLSFLNRAVDIQPDHPYIVGFNSLANGSALNTYSSGNNIYSLNGIYHFFQGGNSLTPIIPFTKGAISFESYYYLPYNSILSLPSPAEVQAITNTNLVSGLCDIGFIPK
ncbi:MAG: hypothetical protein ACJ75B_18145 [Flavisolibacter sp.]